MKKQQKTPECPYLDRKRGRCTHKFLSEKCIFKDCRKCVDYKEWLVLVESIEKIEKDVTDAFEMENRDIFRSRM